MPASTKLQPGPQIRLTAGPLAAEADFLEELKRDLDGRVLEGEAPWAEPLVVVVPSRSLRDHLQERIVAAGDGAVLGVRCTTLFGLALEITEDVGGRLLDGGDLFPLFARRLARREKSLRRVLDHLADGYSALLGSIRDLLDAGLDPAHQEALVEALGSDGRGVASGLEIDRAQALVRVAAATLEELARVGAGRRSTLLAAATDRLRHSQRQPLRARSVWIYGFSDATGVATDLIEALIERYEGRIYLDQPPDPVDNAVVDSGVVFTRRFRERLQTRASITAGSVGASGESPPRHIELFRALGTDGEMREVVRRVRTLIDGGVPPESIAVVVRQLAPYSRAVRSHFANLGVPFSTYTALGGKSRPGRRAEALADLLGSRSRLSVERWLGLVDRRFGDRSHADLRTGFATLGVGRIEEAAALLDDTRRLEHDLKLPVRQGFRERLDDKGASEGIYLTHRRVPAAALRQAVEAAAALVAHLKAWSQAETRTVHEEHFATVLTEHLDWQGDSREHSLATTAVAVWSALPAAEPLSFEEFAEGVALKLRDMGNVALGGEGGGVQLLDVVEARGRTSEHLFLLGLNRGLFPRVVREDPLLPDALRGIISRQGFGVLPDLHDKRSGHDEERFLFAQLLASSPHVTLSWQDTDDDQFPLAPSPLLERLRWTGDVESWRRPELARPVTAQPKSVPRSPLENGIVAALAGPRTSLDRVLEPLLADGRTSPSTRAAVRTRILRELDPPPSGDDEAAIEHRLGPYFGFVGRAQPGDPRRRQRLYVTALERLTGCPWQTFLERVLKLEPVPDPLAALPGITPLLIGSLCHDVLEEIVNRGLGDPPADLNQARQSIPQPVPWPDPQQLEKIVYGRAERRCRQEGITVGGFASVLARAVEPYLEVAKRLDWSAPGGLHVLGAELHGALEVQDLWDETRSIHFRADRLDLGAEGLVLTDYKTGRGIVSHAKQAKSRRRHLLESVTRGERLQAVAYAQAAGESGDRGRYLFIHPELDDDSAVRDVPVAADDSKLADAFANAARAALAVWDTGSFFPRTVVPERDQEPVRCEYCDVREACLRGDSGARRRLREWAESKQRDFLGGGDLSSDRLSLLTLWRLPLSGPQ